MQRSMQHPATATPVTPVTVTVAPSDGQPQQQQQLSQGRGVKRPFGPDIGRYGACSGDEDEEGEIEEDAFVRNVRSRLTR